MWKILLSKIDTQGAALGSSLPEVPNVLNNNWEEYTKRIKPILKQLKEDFKKDIQEGDLLEGLRDLINSNTETMNPNMTVLMIKIGDSFKKETVASTPSGSSTTEAGVTKVTKLTKPAKVPTWTKDMSLETYNKQSATWMEINEDVPEYVKY